MLRLARYRKSMKKAWRRLQNRILGGRRILVLGDSHCGVFEYCFDQGFLAPHLLNCEIVPGGTAYGMMNDHSETMAWQRFNKAMSRYTDFDVVVIMLGECDCSYALWKKSEQCGMPPAMLLERCISGVDRLVKQAKLLANGSRKIIVVGAILPTIADDSIATQENPLRRSIAATQMERTQLVLAYNRRLAAYAATERLDYFDMTEQTISPATGLVDHRYLALAEDHHLSHSATGRMWAEQLKVVL